MNLTRHQTLQPDTASAKLSGYQILYGLGYGWAFQVPALVPQVILAAADVPVGISLMIFCQLVGSAIFAAVGESMLSIQLHSRLATIEGIDLGLLASSSATDILNKVPEALRDAVVVEFNEALRAVFQIGLLVCCISIIGPATLEWRSVKKKTAGQLVEDEEDEEKSRLMEERGFSESDPHSKETSLFFDADKYDES